MAIPHRQVVVVVVDRGRGRVVELVRRQRWDGLRQVLTIEAALPKKRQSKSIESSFVGFFGLEIQETIPEFRWVSISKRFDFSRLSTLKTIAPQHMMGLNTFCRVLASKMTENFSFSPRISMDLVISWIYFKGFQSLPHTSELVNSHLFFVSLLRCRILCRS